MLGFFKRLPEFTVSEQKKSEPKKDRAFIIILLFFSAIIIFTLVRASYDKVMQEQLKNLKISAFDIITFSAAMAGYFITKKRRKK